MSHPEFLKQKFEKAGVQRAAALCWGSGIPRKTLFPFFSRAAAGGARGEEKWGTAPRPRQRAGYPLQSRLSSGLTSIERRFEKFGMTHVRSQALKRRGGRWTRFTAVHPWGCTLWVSRPWGGIGAHSSEHMVPMQTRRVDYQIFRHRDSSRERVGSMQM